MIVQKQTVMSPFHSFMIGLMIIVLVPGQAYSNNPSNSSSLLLQKVVDEIVNAIDVQSSAFRPGSAKPWNLVTVSTNRKERGIVATNNSTLVAMLSASLQSSHYTLFYGSKDLLGGTKIMLKASEVTGKIISTQIIEENGSSFRIEDMDLNGIPDIVETQVNDDKMISIYLSTSGQQPIAYTVSNLKDGFPLYIGLMTKSFQSRRSFYIHNSDSEWLEYVFDIQNNTLKAIAIHEDVPGNIKQALLFMGAAHKKRNINFTFFGSDSVRVSKFSNNSVTQLGLDWAQIYTKYKLMQNRSEWAWKKSGKLLERFKPFDCVLPEVVRMK